MSTKSSIRCAFDDVSHEGFHLYTEAYDDENIYLEMEGFHFEAATLSNLTLEKGSPHIVVKVPVEWAKKLQLIE